MHGLPCRVPWRAKASAQLAEDVPCLELCVCPFASAASAMPNFERGRHEDSPTLSAISISPSSLRSHAKPRKLSRQVMHILLRIAQVLSLRDPLTEQPNPFLPLLQDC
jgi:hypothetical protein